MLGQMNVNITEETLRAVDVLLKSQRGFKEPAKPKNNEGKKVPASNSSKKPGSVNKGRQPQPSTSRATGKDVVAVVKTKKPTTALRAGKILSERSSGTPPAAQRAADTVTVKNKHTDSSPSAPTALRAAGAEGLGSEPINLIFFFS